MLPMSEIILQMPMPPEASLQIPHVDCNVLKLWLSKSHPASRKNSAAKFPPEVPVRGKRNLTKTSSKNILLCIDPNETSLHLSPPTAT